MAKPGVSVEFFISKSSITLDSATWAQEKPCSLVWASLSGSAMGNVSCKRIPICISHLLTLQIRSILVA